MTDNITDHDRIWLEPAGAPDRCWCEDNQWGDEGIEYVRADLLRSVQAGEAEMVAWRVKDFADGWMLSNIEATAMAYQSDGRLVNPLVTLSSHQSVIAAKDAEIERLRAAFGQAGDQSIDQQLRIKVLEGERDELTYLHSERDQGEKIINERLEAAEARANAAVEALEFYRDGFEFKTNPRYGGLEWKPTEMLLDDCGNTARIALSALNGAKP